MRIIEIEGLDKSGKFTQTKLLAEYLRSLGYKVVQSEFHRYDTPTGKLIRDYLYKTYEANDKTIELIMTADKVAQQDWFEQLKTEGVDFLILDRYVGSQTSYALAKGLPIDFVQTLASLVVQPNLSIMLDISPELSMSRKGKHGENDRYESDRVFLTRVREQYFTYFSWEPNKRFILHDLDEATQKQVSDKMKRLVKSFFLL